MTAVEILFNKIAELADKLKTAESLDFKAQVAAEIGEVSNVIKALTSIRHHSNMLAGSFI